MKEIKQLDFLKKENVTLVYTKPGEYKKYRNLLIRYLTKRSKLNGIYISFNQSYPRLVKDFKDDKIDTSKLFFIDCVSKKTKQRKSTPNYYYTNGPQSLTELSIMISEKLKDKKIKFIFFDSVLTLLTYNDEKVSARFIQHVTSKLREEGVKGIFISIDEGTKKFHNTIAQFCDTEIHL